MEKYVLGPDIVLGGRRRAEFEAAAAVGELRWQNECIHDPAAGSTRAAGPFRNSPCCRSVRISYVEESGEVWDNPTALVQAGNWSYLPAFGTASRRRAVAAAPAAGARRWPAHSCRCSASRPARGYGQHHELAALGCHIQIIEKMYTKQLLPLLSFPFKNKIVEYCAVTLKMILVTTSGGHAFDICTLDILILLPLLPFPVEH